MGANNWMETALTRGITLKQWFVSIDGGKQLNGNRKRFKSNRYHNSVGSVSIDGGKQLNGNIKWQTKIGLQKLSLHWWGQTIEWKLSGRLDRFCFAGHWSLHWWGQTIEWKQLYKKLKQKTSSSMSPLMGANNWMETGVRPCSSQVARIVSIDGGKQLNGNSSRYRCQPYRFKRVSIDGGKQLNGNWRCDWHNAN